MAAVLGIAKAIYAYASQQPNPQEDDKELSIEENETLYVLERGDDGWWKVRKKAEGDEELGDEGLVPANYIEETGPISHATAMFDYERQTSEEVTFQEGNKIDIYDKEDPDWFLVGCNSTYGFAPSNYLEEGEVTNHSPAVVAHQGTASSLRPESTISLIPPAPPLPQAATSSNGVNPLAVSSRPVRSDVPDFTDHTALESDNDSDAAPPTPQRPSLPARQSSQHSPIAATTQTRTTTQSAMEDVQPQNARYRTWSVQEVEGKKKKKKGTLGVGDMEISWAPDKASESIQTWPITSLIRYSTEKKHIFIDFQSPPHSASFDFHAGSSDTAAEINSALGELAGAARAPGIREIAGALKAPLPDLPEGSGLARKERENGYPARDASEDDADRSSSSSGKKATVLYDFEAQGDDEVTVRAGARVIILDDRASPDWWKIQVGRREGVIPSEYLEKEPPKKASKKRISSGDGSRNNKHDAAAPELKSQSTGKSKPDSRKLRSWTDRSRTFKVDAQLLGCSDGKIHLHKANGVKISVPINKMCSEDIEYVEHKTGRSLRSDVPMADTKTIAAKAEADRASRRREAAAAAGHSSKPASDFDWFDFFLTVGCDPNVCQRYTSAFERDGLTEEDINSLEPGMLRTLGVKEGDILRIGRAVDARLGRQRDVPASFGDVLQREERNLEGSGLLSGPGGELKNNTRRGRPERVTSTNDTVDASALRSPATPQKQNEDAWAVKTQPARPAQVSHGLEDLSLLDQPLIPVPTQQTQASVSNNATVPTDRSQSMLPKASMPAQNSSYPSQQFLQSIQQMQPQKTASIPAVPAFMPQTSFGSAIVAHKTGGGDMQSFVPPALYPHQTGYAQQQQSLMQPQMTSAPYQDPFKTGGAAPYQDPFKTGIAPMSTGFPSQSTGFGMPMQQTGFMAPQAFAPPQQPQMFAQPAQQPQYGFMQPQATYSVPQQTGFNPAQPYANSSLPAFGGQLVSQQTGFAPPQQTFMPQQTGIPQQQPFSMQGQPAYGNMYGTQAPQPQMSAGMLKMQEMMAQAQAQQTTQTGTGNQQQNGFQPVSFGRSGPTGQQGRKANLNAATPSNPFGL